MSQCQELGELAERLFRAQSFEEAFSAFEERVYGLGFEGGLYTFIPRVTLDAQLPQAPVYQVSDTYSPAYMKHYAEARFDQVDPIVAAVAGGAAEPLDWWTEIKKGEMNAPGKNVIVTAREDYGLTNGLTLPLMCDAHGIAGASVISSEHSRCYEKLLAKSLDRLQLYARIFHSAVQTNAYHRDVFVRPFVANLSRKERTVLVGLAQGKPMKRIASELDTDIKYLEKVIRNAREKFTGFAGHEGPAINRNQLMYYVGLLNLLDFLE